MYMVSGAEWRGGSLWKEAEERYGRNPEEPFTFEECDSLSPLNPNYTVCLCGGGLSQKPQHRTLTNCVDQAPFIPCTLSCQDSREMSGYHISS